jgi:hypothetical protein
MERYHYGILKRELGIVFKAAYRHGVAAFFPRDTVAGERVHIRLKLQRKNVTDV